MANDSYRSTDGKRTAIVSPHPIKESAWCVHFTFPSGATGMKGSFPSKRSATDWARGYVSDPANA